MIADTREESAAQKLYNNRHKRNNVVGVIPQAKKPKKGKKSDDHSMHLMSEEIIKSLTRTKVFAFVPFVTAEADLDVKKPFAKILLKFSDKSNLRKKDKKNFWDQHKQAAYKALNERRNAAIKDIRTTFIGTSLIIRLFHWLKGVHHVLLILSA